MQVLLFGASGMVGQGVLRECLVDPAVTSIVSIARSPAGQSNPKLREVLHSDFLDFSTIEDRIAGFDACFFCLGVSSTGMSEEEYRRITYGFTLAAARVLAPLNPNMTFIYVSGAGTDSSEHGRSMWARVKGKTENDLLGLPFHAFLFRPGLIVPLHGIRSKTKLYRAFYAVLGPLLPLLRALFPNSLLTTEQLGRAMINVARAGWPKPVLEAADIRAAARPN
ncbi:MAG TPA: hypothetical protein VME17_19790 [Bryobacteraceae bacterium]|nr:hypothetical protein [Bryobacteraceae bacterium]